MGRKSILVPVKLESVKQDGVKIDGEKQDGIKLEGIGLDGAETGGDSCDSGCDDQGWTSTVAIGSACCNNLPCPGISSSYLCCQPGVTRAVWP